MSAALKNAMGCVGGGVLLQVAVRQWHIVQEGCFEWYIHEFESLSDTKMVCNTSIPRILPVWKVITATIILSPIKMISV